MRSAKVDANQDQIVAALRAVGATVQSLARMGKGCPDLLVGYHQENFLIEVKDGRRSLSEQKLTSDQIKWHAEWRGLVHVARCVDDALLIVGAIKRNEQ